MKLAWSCLKASGCLNLGDESLEQSVFSTACARLNTSNRRASVSFHGA